MGTVRQCRRQAPERPERSVPEGRGPPEAGEREEAGREEAALICPLTLTIQIRLSTERSTSVMSDELIQRLAGGIKEKDHRELLEKEHQLHRAKIDRKSTRLNSSHRC